MYTYDAWVGDKHYGRVTAFSSQDARYKVAQMYQREHPSMRIDHILMRVAVKRVRSW